MNKMVITLLAGVLLLTGCANQYVMKLTNGTEITSANRPQLQGNVYHFKDANGGDHVIQKGRVLVIEPTSMARDENKSRVGSGDIGPHKRHWYFLWLF